MRLGQPLLPRDSDGRLVAALYDYFRQIANKVNGLSLGQIGARDNAVPSIPTTGTWKRGDFVPNSAPSILGTAGSRYVITGWVRVTDGAANVAGTDWAEARTLTGT